jgi:hypothetical protein
MEDDAGHEDVDQTDESDILEPRFDFLFQKIEQ